MLGHNISVPPQVWRKLNGGWVLFFLFAGCANLYAAYGFDTDAWVNFKLFGMMGMTLLFAIAQGSVYADKAERFFP